MAGQNPGQPSLVGSKNLDEFDFEAFKKYVASL